MCKISNCLDFAAGEEPADDPLARHGRRLHHEAPPELQRVVLRRPVQHHRAPDPAPVGDFGRERGAARGGGERFEQDPARRGRARAGLRRAERLGHQPVADFTTKMQLFGQFVVIRLELQYKKNIQDRFTHILIEKVCILPHVLAGKL